MFGYDISNYQPTLNCKAVNGSFVIQKATEGNWYRDPTMKKHADEALADGKLLGLYAFSDGQDYKSEVDLFAEYTKEYRHKATFWLDFEANALKNGAEYAKKWLAYFEKKTGIKPGIYMMLSAENSMNWADVANKYRLWIAQYNNYNPVGYMTRSLYGSLRHWKQWDIFQYSSAGNLAGYNGNLDVDRAHMTKSDWLKMAQGTESGGDDFEMSWHPRMKYDTKGHVLVNIKHGAYLYTTPDFEQRIEKIKYKTEMRTIKVQTGAYYVKAPDGVHGWLSGEDVLVKTNPLAYNEKSHDLEFVITSDNAYTQNELTGNAKGIKYLPKGSKWIAFGRKGKYIRVGSKATGMYVDGDKGLVRL